MQKNCRRSGENMKTQIPCTAPSLIRCLEQWTVHKTEKIVKVIRATPKNKCLIIFFYNSQYTNCIHVKVIPSWQYHQQHWDYFPRKKRRKNPPTNPQFPSSISDYLHPYWKRKMTQHTLLYSLIHHSINASIHGSPHLAVTQSIALAKSLSQQELEWSSLGYNSMIQIDTGVLICKANMRTPEDLLEFYVIYDELKETDIWEGNPHPLFPSFPTFVSLDPCLLSQPYTSIFLSLNPFLCPFLIQLLFLFPSIGLMWLEDNLCQQFQDRVSDIGNMQIQAMKLS